MGNIIEMAGQKTVLIAGGAGFIGGNLSRHLLAQDVNVHCVDNLITGQIRNVRDLIGSDQFRFIPGDITDRKLVRQLGETQYHEIYHLACPTGVPNIATLGEEMLMTSSVGTHGLLEMARECGAKFLFASTAEAYGNPEVFPQPESYTGNVDPVGPRSPYEVGKRFGEALTAYYSRKFGVDTRIARIFNTYGPGMSIRDRRLVPQMLLSFIHKLPFTIYGDGSQTRSLLHVDDLIRGLMVIMDKGGPGEVYNVGGNVETSVLDIHRQANAAMGLDLEPEFANHFIADHDRRCPDISKLAGLGWRPTTSLHDGLKQSYADMSARNESNLRTIGRSGLKDMALNIVNRAEEISLYLEGQGSDAGGPRRV